ncbi:hypothetical protein [Phytohabitans rumicis]|uniref:AbiTii domain-containing protein n=1 Tax=Phytohabitans rumicis TaxID=1076125 RepID=A0A6V8KZE7_9ACTN|nr:hypothetical protein [Phytohabitans rumicis]GFJ87861.1 hypothetical protein Prum_015030 [Phytohabitans rumicis]
MDINAKRKLRTAFMNWLFETTGGSQDELGRPAGFKVPDGWAGEPPTEADIRDVVRYLEGEYLIKAHWTMGGLPSVQLTHEGIREMEQAHSAPTERTEHFVPLVNITNIQGSVIGSQLQQGSPGSSQTGHFEINQRESAEAFVAAARKLLVHEAMDQDTRSEAEADLAMMSHELEKPAPRWPILKTIGATVRDSLAKAAGTAAAVELLQIPWP